jgi:arabinofuranosyltransferase
MPAAMATLLRCRHFHRFSRRFGCWPGVLVTLALALAFWWEIRVSPSVTVDDAYITFAFSKNVALGHGPVYGHGVVVEGYSNFLWMLLVALGLFLRPAASPTAVAHVLAVPFVWLMAMSTYLLCREKAHRVWCVAAAAALVVHSDVITAFEIGLETIPYTALLTLAFLLYVRSFGVPALRRWVVPAFVAVALMRIDGFLPLGYLLIFEAARRVWSRRGFARADLREYIAWALPAVAVYVAWFAWRWHFYGLPLPSTYYAKALIPKALPHRGWEYVRAECLGNGFFVALPFAALLLYRRHVRGVALVLYVAGHVLYVIKVGGDWMPYGRFLLPILPLTLVIILWGGRQLADDLARRGKRLPWLAVAGSVAVVAFMGARGESHILGSDLQRWKARGAAEQSQHVAQLIAAARLLNLAMPPGARLVTDYGGVLAYYTDAAPIEMWGLCNATIARRGGLEGVQPIFGRTCPECYPELHPEFFHVMAPLVRDLRAFKSHQEVVKNVWQTDTIGRYLNFETDFVAGRVMVVARNQAVYFLERRRPDSRYIPRAAELGVVVDYPFEPGGRAPGT